MKTPLVLEQSSGGDDGFANVYAVELLYRDEPSVDGSLLLNALRGRCGNVVPIGDGAEHWSFAHPEHLASYTDRAVPVQTLIHLMPSGPNMDAIEQALQQSWDWRDARSVVSQCRSMILVTDFMAGALAYRERIALYRRVVAAAQDAAPCAAIHWRPSQRVVRPQDFLEADADGDALYPAINVRLFNIANRAEGDTIMDTLGLAALGIPDVQCHFRGLDVNAMAGVLHNSAYYLFDQGDVIEDGQTIQGLMADQRWRCRHEDALVGPPRVVLDLNPGAPHAAGDR